MSVAVFASRQRATSHDATSRRICRHDLDAVHHEEHITKRRSPASRRVECIPAYVPAITGFSFRSTSMVVARSTASGRRHENTLEAPEHEVTASCCHGVHSKYYRCRLQRPQLSDEFAGAEQRRKWSLEEKVEIPVPRPRRAQAPVGRASDTINASAIPNGSSLSQPPVGTHA